MAKFCAKMLAIGGTTQFGKLKNSFSELGKFLYGGNEKKNGTSPKLQPAGEIFNEIPQMSDQNCDGGSTQFNAEGGNASVDLSNPEKTKEKSEVLQ